MKQDNYTIEYLNEYINKVESNTATSNSFSSTSWGKEGEPPLVTLLLAVDPGEDLEKGVQRMIQNRESNKLNLRDNVDFIKSQNQEYRVEYLKIIVALRNELYQDSKFLNNYLKPDKTIDDEKMLNTILDLLA